MSPNDPLRVMTYNIRYAGIDEGALAWEARRTGVLSTIRFHRPDVIAIQECWLGQFPDLTGRLSGYEWVAHPDRNGEHTPIGYRPDRLALEDTGGFGLAPNGERGVPGWDAVYPRTATWASFRDPTLDRRFSVFSVHLDHRGERARRESARLLVERFPDGPGVIAGDLNCPPEAPPYRTLTAEFADARSRADIRHGPEATYVGFGGLGPEESGPVERKRIDYVLVRGFDVAGYGVATDVDAEWRYPSDHLPVVVDLEA